MRFSQDCIDVARLLKETGLNWKPQCGQFVWDEAGVIDAPSPFHDKVYFILDIKHFLRRTKNIERLKEVMIWLPTWHDCREMLKEFGVTNSQISDYLNENQSIQDESELLALYHLIQNQLTN